MKLLKKIMKINFRSIVLNFYLLPIKQAVHLPLLISNKCKLKGLYRGGVQINSKDLKIGLIQIGYNTCGILDEKYERSIIELGKHGKIIFYGRAFLGNGTRLSVTNDLIIGANLNISGNSSIICCEGINIGNNSIISWDCLILDTDFHRIYKDGNIINENKPIEIGNHVWIGAKSTILKGTKIADGSVIGAGSLCTGLLSDEKSIYAGQPAKLIKKNINWEI